jgi:hypothetical protein
MSIYALALMAVFSRVAETLFARPQMIRNFPVPDAKWCLPSSNLTELSGCIAMTDKEDECGGKESQEDKLDCYCTQEVLNSIFE